MEKWRQNIKDLAKGILIGFAIYLVAYLVNSAAGGYWMVPSRDGGVRYRPEPGGLSMTVAIMWQPRFGHNAVGQLDFLGVLFEPLILLDRKFAHPTHYLIDEGFDAWLKRLSPWKVHPKFREQFVREREKSIA